MRRAALRRPRTEASNSRERLEAREAVDPRTPITEDSKLPSTQRSRRGGQSEVFYRPRHSYYDKLSLAAVPPRQQAVSIMVIGQSLSREESGTEPRVFLSRRLGLSSDGECQQLFVHGFVEAGEVDRIEAKFGQRTVFGTKYHGYRPDTDARYPFGGIIRRQYRPTQPLPETDWEFEIFVTCRQGKTSVMSFIVTPLSDGITATPKLGSSQEFAFPDAIPPGMIHSERVILGGQKSIKIVGWAISLTAVRTVGISFDGDGRLNPFRYQASLEHVRPDVVAWRPEYPNAEKCGFELATIVSTAAIPQEVTVTMVSDGVTCYTSDLLTDLSVSTPRGSVVIHCENAYVFSDGLIFASGWALGDHPIKSIYLAIDGHRVGVANLGGVRDDVADIYPELITSRNSGFQVAARVADLSQGVHHLMLSAESLEGERRDLILQTKTVDRIDLLQSGPLEIGSITLMADCLCEADMPLATRFCWSRDRRELACNLIAGKVREEHPLQLALAKAQRAAWNGSVSSVFETSSQLLLKHASLCLSNDATFMDMLFTQVVLRRFNVVGSMLMARYRPACSVIVSVNDNDLGSAVVECLFDLPHKLHIYLSESIFHDEQIFVRILYLAWIFPQLVIYTRMRPVQNGRVVLNQWDCGIRPGLAYCDYRSDYFLIPDPQFVSTEGYNASRGVAEKHYSRWQERKPMAFWRGATTGLPSPPEAGWRGLPRIALCEIANSRSDIFDVGISSVVQLSDVESESVKKSELMRPYVPFSGFFDYKYQIDIDGNTNSWPGLFHKLLTGSPILKIESLKGYRQWYYGKLKPWTNFVPVASDMSDLIEKIAWLQKNDEKAYEIGQAGYNLAKSLRFETELMYGATVIRDAIRYFDVT